MLKLSMLAAAGAAALTLTATPASTASLYLSPSLAAQPSSSNVIEVQGRRHWHGHRHHHRHHHRGRDALIGFGAGAIIGSALAARPYGYYGGYYSPPPVAYGPGPYAYSGGYADDGWERCRAQFRSLRADGTYTTYDGRQVMCPYLR